MYPRLAAVSTLAICLTTSLTAIAQIVPDHTLNSESSVVTPNQNIRGINSNTPGSAATLRIDDLVSSLLTLLTQGFTQKPINGQFLLTETSEANENLCDQIPQSPQLASPSLATQSQLSEVQRLNLEVQALYSQGLYAKAIPLAERILSIYRKILGNETLEVAEILHQLANLNYSINNISKAEILQEQSLKIRESLLGEHHPLVAQSLMNLAELYRMQAKYAQSESIYQRVLSFYENNCGENHILVVVTLNNLTTLYLSQRRYKEAESISQKALNTYNNLSTDDTRIEPFFLRDIENTILNHLAVIDTIQNNYEQAIIIFRQVIENYEQEQGREHPALAKALNNLAFVQLAQGDIQSALTSLSRGIDIEERNLSLNLLIGSEGEKHAYMNTFIDTTYRAISFHLQSAPHDKKVANLALRTILRRKGRVLDFTANSISLLRENLTSDQQRLFDQLEEQRRQLAMLKFNRVQTLSRRRIEGLEIKVKQLEAKLFQSSMEFKADAKPLEIQDIQKLIPADTVLVELVHYRSLDARASPGLNWGEHRYAAYILSPNGKVNWVDLGEAEPIHSSIRLFGRALSRRSAIFKQTSRIRKAARALDEQLMQPIRQQLDENISHILLSTDGQLNLIPFGALVDEQGQYLIENYTFTYLTSGRDLLRLQIDTFPQQPPVIVANPNFQDRGDPGSDSSPVQKSPNPVSRGMRASYKPLPGTKAEAQAIRGLLPNAIVLTESQATENAIKATKSPQILHLATHGFFLRANLDDPQENPLLRSGLVFAGYNQRSSGGEDGVLTALEVASLNLRGTQLVVLSACQTGLGEIDLGTEFSGFGEGVYGLRRAFVIAGARSQLSSLWNVDDFATKELMEKYYQRLIAGEGISQAWRQTQLEMLQNEQYQHPYYWAAFILSGDWTEITQQELITSRY